MDLRLDSLLALSGRLDEGPGVDTARARFRRFLTEQPETVLRPLLEQAQHMPGEQAHRALEDLVAASGRALGFEIAFGTYAGVPPAPRVFGQWVSRLAIVVVDARTGCDGTTDLDAQREAVAALAAVSDAGRRVIGVVALTPAVNRHRVDEVLAAPSSLPPLFRVSIGTLAALMDIHAAGRLSHEEFVALCDGRPSLDCLATVLDRVTPPVAPVARPADAPASLPPSRPDAPLCWLAAVTADQSMSPEQFLRTVIRGRLLFGLADTGTLNRVRAGDRLCFYIDGRGIVGYGGVRSVDEGGIGLRDPGRFRQTAHLQDLTLRLESPAPLDAETRLRLRVARPTGRLGHVLVRISEGSFSTLTAPPEGAAVAGAPSASASESAARP